MKQTPAGQIKAAKALRARSQAFRKTHIAKRDKGKFVFIKAGGGKSQNPKTGDMLTARGKGWMVYVTKKGKLQIVGGRKKTVSPRRFKSWDALKIGNRKKAVETLKKQIVFDLVPGSEKIIRNKEGLSLKRYAGAVSDMLEIAAESRGDTSRDFLINISFTVKAGKKLKTHFAALTFKIADLQKLDSKVYQNFAEKAVHQKIARVLTAEDQVTIGSKRFVMDLEENQDREPEEWLGSTGDEWGKSDFQTVKIVQFECYLESMR